MASAYTQLTCREGVTWNVVDDCFSRPMPGKQSCQLISYLLTQPCSLLAKVAACGPQWLPLLQSNMSELQQHSSPPLQVDQVADKTSSVHTESLQKPFRAPSAGGSGS